MERQIRIKPHHFVDIVSDYGFGRDVLTPHPYGHALHLVTQQVIEHPEARLVIELGADDICRPCQHNVDGACDDTINTADRPAAPQSKREYNLLIDRRWCDVTGLRQGSRLTVAQFCELLCRTPLEIAEIYREESADYLAEKYTGLRTGIRRMLATGRSPKQP